MSDFATREKNRTYYQEHREQILRATKEWRKRNREKYRAYQKEYWSKHYRNYGTKNRVADRAMRERKKPDVEKALSMFKNPQQAAQACGVANILLADSFADAVQKAYQAAHEPQIVLLSPACSSYDMFKNYPERGRCFKQLVRELTNK